MHGVVVPVGTVRKVMFRGALLDRVKTPDGWKWKKTDKIARSNRSTDERLRCSKCRKKKSASDFYWSKGKVKSWCKACVKKLAKSYTVEHAKHIRQRQAEYKALHKEYYREYARAWVKKNPERARNNVERWMKLNPQRTLELRKAIVARRTGKSISADTVKKVIMLNVKKYGQLTCAYCATRIHGTWNMDHRTPLVRGGSNLVRNLAVACPSCDQLKHTLTVKEFMARKKLSV
jgi:hypothetical protein